jgi:DegV family protein with EDD domain
MEKMILVDSCCNLPSSFYHENEYLIDMVNMPVHLDDMNFLDDHGKTMSYDVFYDYLREGKVPSTSQISPNDFYEKFKHMYENKREIISISFSSGMSGTFNNSVLAKEMFLEDYPEAKITLVDSYCASVGYGVLVNAAMEMLKDGKGDTIHSFIEENKLNVNHFFTVDDLNFLKNGGRIPPALAAVGTLLNLKPMMDVDLEGKLRQRDKVRGRKKAYRQFINTIAEKYDPELSPIIIGHGNCENDAEKLKAMITEELGFDNIIISEESPTIGSHVGPGLLVIGFMGKMRG